MRFRVNTHSRSRFKTAADGADFVRIYSLPVRGDAFLEGADTWRAFFTSSLLNHRPYSIVQGVEVRAIWRPLFRGPKRNVFFLQKRERFFGAVGRSGVLLPDKGDIASREGHPPHPGYKGVLRALI